LLKTTPSRIEFGIVLLPHFTLPELSGFLDLVRLAADEGDQSKPVRCSWTMVGETLEPVIASCGVPVAPWETFDTARSFDYVIVIGGMLESRERLTTATLRYIQRLASTDVTLVGISTGVFCLMRAGVLGGYRVCVPWLYYWEFVQRFPSVDENTLISDQLFVVDRRRITCSGGYASIDVAASILLRHMDAETVHKALHILMVGNPLKGNAPQAAPPGVGPGKSSHPKVRRAILLMEQHVGTRLSLDTLSEKLNMSSRQLERLFKAETGQGPQEYARHVRLRKAAGLLETTDKTVAEIASSCGFADSSHFGREFRKQFGVQPMSYRDQQRGEKSDLAARQVA